MRDKVRQAHVRPELRVELFSWRIGDGAALYRPCGVYEDVETTKLTLSVAGKLVHVTILGKIRRIWRLLRNEIANRQVEDNRHVGADFGAQVEDETRKVAACCA